MTATVSPARMWGLADFDLESKPASLDPSSTAADAGHLFEALLQSPGFGLAVGGFHFERHGFGARQAIGEVSDRIDGPPACANR